MSKFTDIATGLGGPVIGAGMGLLLADYNDRRQYNQQAKLQHLQMQGSKEMTDYQLQKQLELWEKTGYGAQIQQMKKAGINPALMYQSGGPGGSTSLAAGQVSGADAPRGGGEMMGLMGMGMQYQLLKAQKENIQADTANKKAQNPNYSKEGKKIDAETENALLQGIILKYGGNEAQRQWTINKELSTQEYGAKSDELEARSAAANNIIKLSEDGTLQQLSHEELQKLLKGNKLINEQINGQKLQNAISELEKDMQTKLGIDKTAPTWLKMIGRLLMTFIK